MSGELKWTKAGKDTLLRGTPMQGESEIDLSPSEVQRRWELPYDHPESWVQLNATYRQIYTVAEARGYERCREEAAQVAETSAVAPSEEWQCQTIAKAIRALKP